MIFISAIVTAASPKDAPKKLVIVFQSEPDTLDPTQTRIL
jgi:hypothetical protein